MLLGYTTTAARLQESCCQGSAPSPGPAQTLPCLRCKAGASWPGQHHTKTVLPSAAASRDAHAPTNSPTAPPQSQHHPHILPHEKPGLRFHRGKPALPSEPRADRTQGTGEALRLTRPSGPRWHQLLCGGQELCSTRLGTRGQVCWHPPLLSHRHHPHAGPLISPKAEETAVGTVHPPLGPRLVHAGHPTTSPRPTAAQHWKKQLKAEAAGALAKGSPGLPACAPESPLCPHIQQPPRLTTPVPYEEAVSIPHGANSRSPSQEKGEQCCRTTARHPLPP